MLSKHTPLKMYILIFSMLTNMSGLSEAHSTLHTSLRLKLAYSSFCSFWVRSTSLSVELASITAILVELALTAIVAATTPLASFMCTSTMVPADRLNFWTMPDSRPINKNLISKKAQIKKCLRK